MTNPRIKLAALTGLAAFAFSFGAAPATSHEISCSAASHITRNLSGSEPPLATTPILRFVNLSDSHILDDEGSPVITGNYTESALEPSIGNNSAQRLQEEYTDEVLNAMIKTINECNTTSSPLELMIATGDLTDNMTLNETRRYIDNLDGVESQDTAYEANCGYLTTDSNGNGKLDGELPECPAELSALLEIPTGKQVEDSQALTPDPDDPTYALAPTRSARQIAETFAASVAHGSHFTAPGLPAPLRCDASETGCDNTKLEIEHYAVFGNHDGSVRGTVTMQRPFQAGPASVGRYFFQSQREFVNEWFYTQSSPGPIGHGFNFAGSRLDDADDRNDGWYAFDAGTGDAVRMIVVNTIWDGVIGGVHRNGQTNAQTKGLLGGNEVTNAIGLEQGWVSAEQYAWLESELAAAAAAGKPALVFSHHPDRSFADRRLGRTPDLFEGAKTAVQVDELLGRSSFADPANATVTHPNTLVAWIAGHTHENLIAPCNSGPNGCPLSGSGGVPNIQRGFWRVETSSLIDYPQEGRIVELYALQGGGYGLKLTMISPDPDDGTSNLSHELSIAEAECKTSSFMGGPASSGPYNQARLETFVGNVVEAATGEASIREKFCLGDFEEAKGQPTDRNVVLLP